MTVLQIIRAEAGGELRRLILIANVSGIANVLLLASINAATHDREHAGVLGLLLFLALLAVFADTARRLNHRLTRLIEGALHRIKTRVTDALVQAELDALERVGAAEICERITENMTSLSDRTGIIATLLQSVALVVFLLLYVAWLSPVAFALVLLLVGLGLAQFLSFGREFSAQYRQMLRIRVEMFERLGDLILGFKQLRFGRRLRADLRADVAATSAALRRSGRASNELFADNVLVGETVLYALLGALVYGLPHYVALEPSTSLGLVTAATFLWGPVVALATGTMAYARANLALAEVSELELRLREALRHADGEAEAEPWSAPPTTLELRAIEYRYSPDHGEQGFHIGPIDLRVRAGEIVFIVGGNGSGKSTLLKVLTGLYPPSAGRLELDGVVVTPERLTAYREQFGAIFGDFHLFERLHGLEHVSDDVIAALLAQLQLTGVTSVVDHRITKLALSTGQRKRLAMLVCLLDDRPIVVFDEWAADQEPEFRRYFYDELLAQLRSAGKLVIAVSHDDRYFDRADRIVRMEEGRCHEIVARRADA